MDEFKGTPGPWSIDNNIEGLECIWGDNGARVCTMRHDDSEPNEVNAQLIAAAPEMIDKLIESRKKLSDLVHMLDKQYNLWSHHRQALYDICNEIEPVITKALGKGNPIS